MMELRCNDYRVGMIDADYHETYASGHSKFVHVFEANDCKISVRIKTKAISTLAVLSREHQYAGIAPIGFQPSLRDFGLTAEELEMTGFPKQPCKISIHQTGDLFSNEYKIQCVYNYIDVSEEDAFVLFLDDLIRL